MSMGYIVYRADLADGAAVQAMLDANPTMYPMGTAIQSEDGDAWIIIFNDGVTVTIEQMNNGAPVVTYWEANADNIYNTNIGNVGINTQTPASRLTVKEVLPLGEDYSLCIEFPNDDAGVDTGGSGIGGYRYSLLNPNQMGLSFWYSDAAGTKVKGMHLNPFGGLSIGTELESAQLDVDSESVNVARFQATTQTRAQLLMGNSISNDFFMVFDNYDMQWLLGTESRLAFTGTDSLSGAGHLGIGTVTPLYPTHIQDPSLVFGESKLQLALSGAEIQTTESHIVAGLGIYQSTVLPTTMGLTFFVTSFAGVGGGPYEAMRLSTTGNLGVGTTNPAATVHSVSGTPTGIICESTYNQNQSRLEFRNPIAQSSLDAYMQLDIEDFIWVLDQGLHMRLTKTGQLDIGDPVPVVLPIGSVNVSNGYFVNGVPLPVPTSGAWTPTVDSWVGAISTSLGTWKRVGNTVTVRAKIAFTGFLPVGSEEVDMLFGGLPFTIEDNGLAPEFTLADGRMLPQKGMQMNQVVWNSNVIGGSSAYHQLTIFGVEGSTQFKNVTYFGTNDATAPDVQHFSRNKNFSAGFAFTMSMVYETTDP
jgi:hypothetical protein